MADPNRFLRMESLFRRAAELPSDQHARFLAEQCADDPLMQRHVAELLRQQATASPDTFLANAVASARGATELESGDRIGPYQILETLGEGGMGTVYLAEQRQPVRRRVALKVIKLGMDSKAVLARFEAERQALSMMEHGSVARIYDAGTTSEGRPYFAMEYVKGVPITDYCDENKLSIPARIELFRLVCIGVQHAHMKGVMHRDLKPGNILVALQDGKPVPKIIDFGLAKAVDHRLVEATIFTQHGQIIGTPEYMSPEQAGLSGLDVDTRTDIYSLGVLLYELLTGELPFSRQDLARHGYSEMQRILRETEPPKPSTRITVVGKDSDHAAKRRGLPSSELRKRLRGDLDWIVLKALEKDRTRRYETAVELATDLQRHLDELPVLAGPPSAGYRLRKYVRRHKGLAAAVTLLSLSLSGGATIAAMGWAEADAQAEIARSALEDFQTLRFVTQHRTAVEKEKLLGPPRKENVPAMQAWLREQYEPLDRQLPRIQALLRDLESADPTAEAGELIFLKEQLSQAVQQLDQLEVLARAVRSRIHFAEQVVDLTEHHRGAKATWKAVQQVLSNSPKYASARIHLDPLPGLVPMGCNPGTGLLEFYDLQSAMAWNGNDDPASLQIPAAGESLGDRGAMGIVYVLVPGGRFWMGSPDLDTYTQEAKFGNEKPSREVTLEPFMLARYELTQGQWARLSGGSQPSFYRSGQQPGPGVPPASMANPVELVSWEDCMGILARIGATLPTEAQWERACRAETEMVWSTGDDPGSLAGYANVFDQCALRQSQWEGAAAAFDDSWWIHAPVGSFRPNPFGFHDLHGNVWEWCRDGWIEYGRAEPTGGDGLRTGDPSKHMLRGGSYNDGPIKARCAMRYAEPAGSRNRIIGARAARLLTQ